ncbi:MAG: hypothetical protein H6669_14700 [Ardenticatenaceae bacterium]|nr:hypothetical protein [Ardenticatenaceae bacterium]
MVPLLGVAGQNNPINTKQALGPLNGIGRKSLILRRFFQLDLGDFHE